ncbi:cysteine synthase A [Desulfoplanes formicivorans]|uniref:Cysteine synthase n=1 Tax=Desulfoplanes formicivorans TaxID=1592317 RepID=A0A194AJI1_9BACT|nr:cysteine synthase A [Desulfoplanes formicivorans]GAU08899.1 cysteine synthase [Desulfoplanes formicivorans]
MNIADSMLDLVGKTPLVRVQNTAVESGAQVLGKLEFFNPCGSVKDRIALHMIEAAMARGDIGPDSVIIEPTSGNTGIGLAFVCAVKKLRLILTMPENMSIERRKMLKGLGAELVLTPASKGMKGAIERAQELLEASAQGFMPMQFDNMDNPAMHYETTGPEIWEDTDGSVDILVAGVGTGGTIMGTGRYLKERNPQIRIVAVEPEDSAVLSGNAPGPHMIQGIGAGFVPKVVDKNLLDEIVPVSNEDAVAAAKKLMCEQGIVCGISSGANCHAAMELARRPENQGKTIVFIVCDTGERYLSTALFGEM